MPDQLRTYELLLGYSCDAKCAFCYNPPLTEEVLRQKITLRRAVALLSRARQEGFGGVWFTGGEPTLSPELPKLLLAARKLGFSRIQIGTHGAHLAEPGLSRRLAQAGLNYARISIHSADAARHDAIVGIPGAFERAVRAVSVLRGLDVHVGVNFVVTRANYRGLPDFAKFCASRLGLHDVDVIFPHYRGGMEGSAAELGVRYATAMPSVRRAFETLTAGAEGDDRPTLVNAPPCVAPDLLPWTSDWATEEDGDALAVPGRGPVDLHRMKGGQRLKPAQCGRCALFSRCLGYEAEYAWRFGPDEFAPISREQAVL